MELPVKTEMHSVPIAQVWPAQLQPPPQQQHWQAPIAQPLVLAPQLHNGGLVGSRGPLSSVLPMDLGHDEMALVHVFLACFVILVFICLYMAVQSMRMTTQLTMTHQLMVQIAMMLAQQLQQRR